VILGDDLKLPRDLQTAWARKDGKGFYNIGALAFYLANRELKPPDYLKKVGAEGFLLVQMNDRKSILDYFTGVISSCDAIDESVRPSTLVKKSALKLGSKAV